MLAKKKAKISKKQLDQETRAILNNFSNDNSDDIELGIELFSESEQSDSRTKQFSPSQMALPKSNIQMPQQFSNNLEDMEDLKYSIREKFLHILELQMIFPSILSHINITSSQCLINFSAQLDRILEKALFEKCKFQEKAVVLKSKQRKYMKDERIIFEILLAFSDKVAELGLLFFNLQADDYRNIKKSYNKTRLFDKLVIKHSSTIKQIIQNIKILYIDLQEMEAPISTKHFQQQKKNTQSLSLELNIENNQLILPSNGYKQFKSNIQSQPRMDQVQSNQQINNHVRREFAIRMLILKLNELEIVVPDILKCIKFIYVSKRHFIPDERGILILCPSEDIVGQLCKMAKLSEFAQQYKLDTIFSSSEHLSILERIEIEYPPYRQFNLHDVLVLMLKSILKNYQAFKEGLLAVYEDEQFKQLLLQIWTICGEKINLIQESKVDSNEEFQKFGCNILKIGAMLFAIKHLIYENVNQEGPLIEQSLVNRFQSKQFQTIKPIIKQFIRRMVEKKKPYPLLLKLLHYGNFTIKIIPRKRVHEAIVYTKQFIKFINNIYNYPLEQKTMQERIEVIFKKDHFQVKEDNYITWPQLIFFQLDLIYQNRVADRLKIQEAVKTKQFQYILSELALTNETMEQRQQIKELLISLGAFIKEPVPS